MQIETGRQFQQEGHTFWRQTVPNGENSENRPDIYLKIWIIGNLARILQHKFLVSLHTYAKFTTLCPTVFSYSKTMKFETFDLENECQRRPKFGLR